MAIVGYSPGDLFYDANDGTMRVVTTGTGMATATSNTNSLNTVGTQFHMGAGKAVAVPSSYQNSLQQHSVLHNQAAQAYALYQQQLLNQAQTGNQMIVTGNSAWQYPTNQPRHDSWHDMWTTPPHEEKDEPLPGTVLTYGHQGYFSLRDWFYRFLDLIEDNAMKSSNVMVEYSDRALQLKDHRNFTGVVDTCAMLEFVFCNGFKPKYIMDQMEARGLVFS